MLSNASEMGDNVLKACPSIQWFLIGSMSAIRGYTFNLIVNSRAISFISYFKWLNIGKNVSDSNAGIEPTTEAK